MKRKEKKRRMILSRAPFSYTTLARRGPYSLALMPTVGLGLSLSQVNSPSPRSQNQGDN
jgi:hypothetical protein